MRFATERQRTLAKQQFGAIDAYVSDDKVALSQEFSGPGRPSRHFEYFGRFEILRNTFKCNSSLSMVTQVKLS